ncbi:MAG: DNA-binding protein, partial [Verrucomicrobia bacterium]|nr:DNA-binding protein [Verrucomicrobiota bacterium]
KVWSARAPTTAREGACAPHLIRQFQKALLQWFSKNRRSFAWRRRRTTYRVLVAELMLRRTQAVQVEPVFRRFLKKFPGAQSLARARPMSIRRELKPLGLEWRADNVVKLAREIQRRFRVRVPTGKAELLSLPGVGPYVAGAVRCFALSLPEPLIDTNVVRVIGRFFGLRLEGEARRRKEMINAAAACVPRRRPADYHYALLDFAAAVCTARQPRCGCCPLRVRCDYYAGK